MPKRIDEAVKQKIVESARTMPYRAVAGKYGVTPATVSKLVRGAGVPARARGRAGESARARRRQTEAVTYDGEGIYTSQAVYDCAEWLVRGVNAGFIEIR